MQTREAGEVQAGSIMFKASGAKFRMNSLNTYSVRVLVTTQGVLAAPLQRIDLGWLL
jgi:hypothetical protein